MFLMAGAFLCVAPMLPTIQQHSGLSVATLGFISAASLMCGMVSQLVLGPQADRGHERVMCIGAAVVQVAALAWTAVADTVWELVVSRGMAGISYSAFATAAAALVIRTNPSRVGQGMARLQAGEFAGFAMGPMAAALLEPSLGLRWSLTVVALAAVLSLPLSMGLRTTVAADAAAPPPAMAFDLLRRSGVWVALLLAMGLMVPVGVFDSIWSRYLQDLGASHVVVAVSFATTTLPFLVFAPFAGRLVDRWGPMRGTSVGILVIVASMVAYGVLTSVWAIIGVTGVEAFGQALAGPGAAAAMANASGAERAGAGQGLARAVSMTAAGGVAMVSAGAYGAWGGTAVFCVAAGAVALMILGARLLAAARAPEVLRFVPGGEEALTAAVAGDRLPA